MVKVKSRWDIFAFQLRIINWHLLNISKWICTSFPQAFIFILVASHSQTYPCVIRDNIKLCLKNLFKRGGDTRGEQEAPNGYNHTRSCVETPGQRHRLLGKENLRAWACVRSGAGKIFKRKQRKGRKENRMTN